MPEMIGYIAPDELVVTQEGAQGGKFYQISDF